MVGWNRLLAGRWRDPLIGRDLLLGGLLGVSTTLLFQVQTLLPDWMGLPPEPRPGKSDQKPSSCKESNQFWALVHPFGRCRHGPPFGPI